MMVCPFFCKTICTSSCSFALIVDGLWNLSHPRSRLSFMRMLLQWMFCYKCAMKHDAVLQTASCVRQVATVEEKEETVPDCFWWYIIDRISAVIGR